MELVSFIKSVDAYEASKQTFFLSDRNFSFSFKMRSNAGVIIEHEIKADVVTGMCTSKQANHLNNMLDYYRQFMGVLDEHCFLN